MSTKKKSCKALLSRKLPAQPLNNNIASLRAHLSKQLVVTIGLVVVPHPGGVVVAADHQRDGFLLLRGGNMRRARRPAGPTALTDAYFTMEYGVAS